MLLLPLLLLLAGLAAFFLGKLMRVQEEAFLAGLAGAVIANLLIIVALTPMVLALPESWGWIAAIAAVVVIGEAVRVRFAYRAAENLKELWDLVSFGLGGALLQGVLIGLQVAFDYTVSPPTILDFALIVLAVLTVLVHGASISALVRGGWAWWSTFLVSTMAATAFLLSSRVDAVAGWLVLAATVAGLLALAFFASRGRWIWSS